MEVGCATSTWLGEARHNAEYSLLHRKSSNSSPAVPSPPRAEILFGDCAPLAPWMTEVPQVSIGEQEITCWVQGPCGVMLRLTRRSVSLLLLSHPHPT